MSFPCRDVLDGFNDVIIIKEDSVFYDMNKIIYSVCLHSASKVLIF
jgi:hypothetical protein